MSRRPPPDEVPETTTVRLGFSQNQRSSARDITTR
jgi:hypothetical protein